METRVSLYVVIDNETGHATIRSNVSMWDDAVLRYNATLVALETIERPAELEHSMYPYAVAVTRNASDRAVAEMLEKIAAGETMPLHQVHFDPIT